MASLKEIGKHSVTNLDISYNSHDFERIFKENFENLVNYAYTYLFDLKESEDLVQGLFIYIWENRKALQIHSSVNSYLITAVKNRCLNQLEKLKVRDNNDLLFVEGIFQQVSHSSNHDNDLTERLITAFHKLPSSIKAIMNLKYFENEKIKDIAIKLGISENTVKTQLKRGRVKLRKTLSLAVRSFNTTLLSIASFLIY